MSGFSIEIEEALILGGFQDKYRNLLYSGIFNRSRGTSFISGFSIKVEEALILVDFK